VSSAGMTVLAVASGKGGTGKTTVAAHLASASARTRSTILVDLDVEAPDATGYPLHMLRKTPRQFPYSYLKSLNHCAPDVASAPAHAGSARFSS